MRLSAPIYQLKRRAKGIARTDKIALHEALDRVAREEGFEQWSLLSSRACESAAPSLLSRLTDGDLLLLAARPGQGKTRLGLRLLLDAACAGRRAVFFTLEYTEPQARALAGTLDQAGASCADRVEVVTSDDISADLIIRLLADAPKATVAVIDYLQILDQDRRKPALAEQMRALKRFAHDTGVVFGFLSQIDRAFDPRRDGLPGIGDIRLPNALAEHSFSAACFLHGDQSRFQRMR